MRSLLLSATVRPPSITTNSEATSLILYAVTGFSFASGFLITLLLNKLNELSLTLNLKLLKTLLEGLFEPTTYFNLEL